MLSSSTVDRESIQTLVTVEAPPGVEIQIIDGNYQVLSRSTEKLTIRLSRGIYLIRWLAPDKATETIVRLLPTDSELHIPFPDVTLTDPEPAQPAREALARTRNVSAQTNRECAIVILERSGDEMSVHSPSSAFRLYNKDEVTIQSDDYSLEATRKELEGGWALAVYPVTAGNYRLRYEASTGMSLDQTIVAFAGRRTLALFTQEAAETLVPEEGVFKRYAYVGVNPEKTLIVTIPNGADDVDPNDVRISEVLLQGIAFGGDPLDQNMLARVASEGVDPLIRIYAAALIIKQLVRKASPALDDPYPPASGEASDVDNVNAFESRWKERALQLIKEVQPADASPDLIALRWHLGMDDDIALSAPPQLVASWESAARHSIAVPDSVPDTPSFRAASRARTEAGPWLAWRATGAKQGTVADEPVPASSSELQEVVSQFSSNLSYLQAFEPEPGERANNALLEALSPDSRGLVSAALNVDLTSAETGTTEILEKLAGSLLTPASQLKEKLEVASVELERNANDDLIDSEPPEDLADEPQIVPALRLPILHFDDPQKGRFGGKAADRGFSLSATFSETADPRWVGIHLIVTAELKAGKKKLSDAEFFLHDTFNPSHVASPFVNNRAELNLQAFGGFTVGVWVQSYKVQLELDLAALEYAPAVIKEW